MTASQKKHVLPTAVGLAVLIAAMLCPGCTGSDSYGPNASAKQYPILRSTGATDVGGFTIVLAQYDFQDRSTLAQALTQRAKKILQTDDVWLQNESNGLSVNFGRFDRKTSPKKLEQELKRVRKVYASLNTGPYQFCFIREIPEPDPPANPEWNLLNQDCYFALEIAAYFNVPEKKYFNRKNDAVQAVKNLRDGGDPAFFVHGQKESRVYIGCMPRNIALPFVDLLQKKYPHYHENGAVLYNIHYDGQGKKVRLPRETVLIELGLLKEEVPF